MAPRIVTTTKKIGLILTGGGARAAYQVGVLKAVAELLGEPRESPFAILCGTSAGAINAAALAIHADDFGESVRHLVGVWEGFHCHQVYRDKRVSRTPDDPLNRSARCSK